MSRCLLSLVTVSALLVGAATARAAEEPLDEVNGFYLEARTCQVYTGPCFANSEVGLTGQDAIMAWSIEEGTHAGIDVSGLNVVVVLRAKETLAHQGIAGAGEVKSVVLVDERATAEQQTALVAFARKHASTAGQSIVRVASSPIEMSLNTGSLEGKLQAGKEVKLVTRKARPTDCICSNESAFYPPLTELDHFAAGVTVDGGFQGRGLGSRWSIPDSRSAYMATFCYE